MLNLKIIFTIIFLVILLLTVFFTYIFFIDFNKSSNQDEVLQNSKVNSEIVEYEIEGQNFSVYVADSEEERLKGLSGIYNLDADGMLFVFETPREEIFWNKDTHLDLEILWIRGDRVIKRDLLPSVDKVGIVRIYSPTKVDRVLELVVR